MAANDTRDYYERTQWLYNLLWSKSSLSYGLWEPGTRSVAEAMENQYQYIRTALKVTSDDHLVDLGCGTGGAAIRLAQLTGCRVTGITLSEKQISQAEKMAKASGVDQLVSFQRVDFEQPLPFKDHSFTKAFAVEALCHAADKAAVLTEVFRVIAPEGLFLILDGFLRTGNMPPDQERSYRRCLVGWRVAGLAEKQQFQRDLVAAGFRTVNYQEKSDRVTPASQRIHRWGVFLWPMTALLSAVHIIPLALHANTLAMIEQVKAFSTYAEYGVVLAEK